MKRYISYLIVFILILNGCAFTKFLLPKKSLAELENNFALKCVKLNLWREARYHLEKAYRLNPNSSAINNNLAVVYEYFNDIENSKKFYLRAVKLSKSKIYRENLILFLKENNLKENFIEEKYLLNND